VNLPSRARPRGRSLEGVGASERVTLEFSSLWPLRAPKILLRRSFPAHFAHINPHKPREKVPPCIFEGPVDELLHRHGLDGIMDQTVVWLGRAAAGELLDLSQGWEQPTRRTGSTGYLLYDPDEISASLPTDGAVFATRMTYSASDVCQLGRVIEMPALPFSQAPHSARHPDFWAGESAFFAARAPFIDGHPHVFRDYLPDSVGSIQDLYDRARLLGIDTSALEKKLREYLRYSFEKNPSEMFLKGFYVGVVLGAHRPVPIIGSGGRSIELIPYMMRIPPKGKSYREVMAAVNLQKTSARLLARASGHPEANLNQRIVSVGCGSVGSKLAMHLGRAGFGNFAFVDNDLLQPHNAARNALPGSAKDFVLPNKAQEMENAFKGLSHDKAVSRNMNAIDLLAKDGKDLPELVGDEGALMLDATASSVVLAATIACEYLNRPEIRVCSVKMYARGRIAVVLLEGTGRSVRLDDLTAELFARCRIDADLRRAFLIEAADPQSVFMGENCRSLTMPMSDSTVSRGTALMAMQVQIWLQNEIPDEARLCLGLQNGEGIGMDWQDLPVAPTHRIGGGGWEIRVLGSVAAEIERGAMCYGKRETGGALMGLISEETKTIIVAGLVDAPPDSIREEERFVLGTEGLLEALIDANEMSVGHLSFVGTWHSHPMGGPLSYTDFTTLAAIAEHRRGSPAVSLVWTPTGFNAAVGLLN
jgi:hypothetical protein